MVWKNIISTINRKNPLDAKELRSYLAKQTEEYSTEDLMEYKKAEWEKILSAAAGQVTSSPKSEKHVEDVIAGDTYDSSWLPILQYCVRFVNAKQEEEGEKIYFDSNLNALEGFECHLEHQNKKPCAIYFCCVRCKSNSK